ncbi:MAG TPA: hypothetical protein VE173_02085, partial [Longimicrobiales bacterium]|nr:hypothetical protein [Longimicrobiales bacterium]
SRSGIYEWDFVDGQGGAAEGTPAPLDLTLVGDSAPDVRITFPGRDTLLPLNQKQPLVLEAQDDYGVRTLELVAWRVTSLGERQEPVVQSLELGANRGVLARPVLDVSGWGLLPGDTVHYLARATDNRPDGQTATSREYRLWMPGAAELRREAQHRLEDAAREVEELAGKAAKAAEDTRDLERQAASGRERSEQRGAPSRRGPPPDERAGFQEREDVRQALERQSELQSSVDSVRSELEEIARAMEEAGASDPDLGRDLQELQELLNEAVTPETREQLQEVMRKLDPMDVQQAAGTLEQLREEQEAMREQLEASLERFRRAAVEQDFRATTEEAADLAREERALGEAMQEDGRPEGRAEQQDEIRRRTGDMESRMERLRERLQKLGEKDAAEAVQGARERASESRSDMEKAGQQARRGEGREAGERAGQAARKLDETAERLEEARQQQAQQQAEAQQQALRRAADDALSLARRQSALSERMEEAGRDELAQLRGDVAAVQQGVRNMAEKLPAGSGANGGTDRALSTLLGQAMQALERTVGAMESRDGSRPAPSEASEEVVNALNQVALTAMAGSEQAGQGQAGRGQQDLQQMIESLAQRQGRLNNQAGQIMPMQLGEQALQSQMQELSRGQQGVADELGRMADRQGSEESLGDLKTLAREAEELAHELAGGRLDAPTRARQERLFHRLLDAGRSLEKDEYSDERESRTPGAFERGEATALTPETLDALLFRLPGAEALRRLTPAERRLVLEYFERLNREGRKDRGAPPTPPGGSPGGSEP